MAFQKACGCKRHKEYCTDEDGTLLSVSSKKIKVSIIEDLLNEESITKKTKYVCTGCVKYMEGDAKRVSFDTFISNIRNNEFDIEQMKTISSALGASQHETIKKEAMSSSGNYKVISNFTNFDVKNYIQSRNVILVSFVLSLAGLCLDDAADNGTLLYVAYSIDCIYGAVYPKCVSVFCFMISLMCYVLSGSKTICHFLSSISPSGCYRTILNWLQDNVSLEKLAGNHDIFTFFDNNQILSRNWNIRYNSKALLSAITTSIHISPPKKSSHQTFQNLSPSVWLHVNRDPLLMHQKLLDFVNHYENIFCMYRSNFIKSIIEKVNNEFLECSQQTMSIADYCDVVSSHGGIPTIVTGAPLFLNPCSYQAVEEVLASLHSLATSGNERKWSMIGCDGLPYILGSRLIEKK